MQVHQTDQGFQIEIADHNLQFKPQKIADPIVTGQQLLQLAGVRPSSDFAIYQWLPTGRLEEMHPEETTDLRELGTERFVLFRTDRSFRFTLDERVFDWGATHISGATLKHLAEVDVKAFDVWLDTLGGQDQVISDPELVDLTAPGVERFLTKVVHISIFVNGKPRLVNTRVLNYWDVVRLAFPSANPSESTIYTIDYGFGPPSNPEGTLVDSQDVKIKDGMKFYVTPTDKS